jgi:hypothetical protein
VAQNDRDKMAKYVWLVHFVFKLFVDSFTFQRALNHILQKDKKKHGNDANFEIVDRHVEDAQQEVDDLIEAQPGGTTVYSGDIQDASGAGDVGDTNSEAVQLDSAGAEA